MKKKVCIVTGTRAEYGLFHPLLKKIREDEFFDLQIAATGAHLSPEFGLTYREIEQDGFRIDEKVEMLLSSDTAAGVSKSIGMGIASFADTCARLKPDMLMVLGDRFETFAASVSAFMAGIPIAHLHGGELTEGAVDDALRHSITKMSLFHFTSAEAYRKRVIQLGESPDRVFNVGAPGIDNIKETNTLSGKELEDLTGFAVDEKTLLVTFHPATLEHESAQEQFGELIAALDVFRDLKFIFTGANADADGRVITHMIKEYVKANQGKAAYFSSLGRKRYISAMKYAGAVIGNSSSGLIEFPCFHKPTVNIGDRQRGRVRAGSVIDCRPEKNDIKAAIGKALSAEFKDFCLNVQNPYGDGHASEKIIHILKQKLREPVNLRKGFYDMNDFSVEQMKKNRLNAGDADAEKRYIHC